MCEVRFPIMVSRCLVHFEEALRQIQSGHADPADVEEILKCGAATCRGLADLGSDTGSLVGWCLRRGGVIPSGGTLRALARAADDFEGGPAAFGTRENLDDFIRYVHMLARVLERQSQVGVYGGEPPPRQGDERRPGPALIRRTF